MKQIIGWTSKHILLPLIPFVVGTFVRITMEGNISLESFDPIELSFSMAMLSLLVLISIQKLHDISLRDSLHAIYVLAIVIFITLFACSIFLKLQIDNNMEDSIDDIQSFSDNNNLTKEDVINIIKNRDITYSESILMRFRIGAIIGTFVCIPSTIYFRVKYKLED